MVGTLTVSQNVLGCFDPTEDVCDSGFFEGYRTKDAAVCFVASSVYIIVGNKCVYSHTAQTFFVCFRYHVCLFNSPSALFFFVNYVIISQRFSYKHTTYMNISAKNIQFELYMLIDIRHCITRLISSAEE